MGFMLRERLDWGGGGEGDVERARRSVVPSKEGGLFEVDGEQNSFVAGSGEV